MVRRGYGSDQQCGVENGQVFAVDRGRPGRIECEEVRIRRERHLRERRRNDSMKENCAVFGCLVRRDECRRVPLGSQNRRTAARTLENRRLSG